MPDIAMCQNESCNLKTKCYRYTAKPCRYQCYGLFVPVNNEKCEYFWDNSKYETSKIL